MFMLAISSGYSDLVFIPRYSVVKFQKILIFFKYGMRLSIVFLILKICVVSRIFRYFSVQLVGECCIYECNFHEKFDFEHMILTVFVC